MKYSEILIKHADLPELTGDRYRIKVLSNITINQIQEILELRLREVNIPGEVSIGNFDNIVQDSFSVNEFDCVIIFMEFCELIKQSNDLLVNNDKKSLNIFYDHTKDKIKLILENLKNTNLVVFNLFHNPFNKQPYFAETKYENIVSKINMFLKECSSKSIYTYDLGRNFQSIGHKNSINMRDYYRSTSLYTPMFLNSYCEEISLLISSYQGNRKKLLILDCDNTLWPGIYGEEGKHISIKNDTYIGKIFHEIHVVLKELLSSGVLLSVVSKNNYEDVVEAFSSIDGMTLKFEDFICHRINWSDKVQNIVDISNELNIGLDSVVFVDDSDFEVNNVKDRLPEVVVFKVPTEEFKYPSLFIDVSKLFFNPIITDEDRKKTTFYKQQIARKSSSCKFSSLDDYLKDLKIEIKIFKNEFSHLERIAQLTQKTNQFNLTTTRHTENEIENMLHSKNFDIYTLSVSDKFGDDGLTGVLFLQRFTHKNVITIENFLLSCRILGRDIEYAFINEILTNKHNIHHTVLGKFISSEKNHQVKEFYSNILFDYVQIKNNCKIFECKNFVITKSCEHITVESFI